MKGTVQYLFEAGNLKNVKRSGWWLIGIRNPESVAEHSFRAAVVAYVLAEMEGANAEKAAMMALFNDVHEARINDLHKLGHRYIEFKDAETRAFEEQLERLPKGIAQKIWQYHDDFQKQSSRESVIARDADLLECALQAREYQVQGYADASEWIENIWKIIKTSSARKMLKELERAQPSSWWRGLKKVQR